MDVKKLDHVAEQAFIKSVRQVVIDFMSVSIFDVEGVTEFVEDFMTLFPFKRFDVVGSASGMIEFFVISFAGR
tara:strand:- start:100 stop:318 length:219 start_codon:yes stop_codon:yes gene_type:complete